MGWRTVEVDGPFRTGGAAVFQAWVDSISGQENVLRIQVAMRQGFTRDTPHGAPLGGWINAEEWLAIESKLYLFGLRASQSDLDNLLKQLFDQMRLRLFPGLTPHERSRKDRYVVGSRVWKIEVADASQERSMIMVRPLVEASLPPRPRPRMPV